MTKRLRSMRRATVDVLLTVLVLGEALIEALLVADEFHWALVPLGAMVASGAGLHRRAPMTGMLLGLAAVVLYGLLPAAAVGELGGPFLAVMFSVYSMALRYDPPRLWLGTAAALAAAVGARLTGLFDPAYDDMLVVLALLVAGPIAAGQLLRSRIALSHALRERAERAERERRRRAEHAVAEERTRIAGELHDVIAHALGAMTVQAAAARRLTTRDAQRAELAFQAVENTGRETLTEIRHLLGVLRRDDVDLALAPQPNIGHLRDLARRLREAGLPVDVEVEGEPSAPVPAGVDHAAFRLVEEALEEARGRGCAGHATVRVRFDAEEVVVEVIDDGCSPQERSLLAMRERVRVYGGDLDAVRVDGGHVLRARLPLEAPA